MPFTPIIILRERGPCSGIPVNGIVSVVGTGQTSVLGPRGRDCFGFRKSDFGHHRGLGMVHVGVTVYLSFELVVVLRYRV